MSNPRLRRDYRTNPGLEDRVFDLLETWFRGISKPRQVAARLGSSWEDCSTPFVVEEAGQIVSHVGLLEMPYVVDHQRRQLGGVHGVCTLESERRKGHFRRIMDELLEYCDGRFDTLELSTANPEYYEPFGFRKIPEYRFIQSVQSGGGAPGFRAFDFERASDLDALNRLLVSRTPLSHVVGLVEEVHVFKFSQGVTGLHYCEALDCFVVYERGGTTLSLYDVVASELPSVEAILSQIPDPIETVEYYFSPDRFAADARAEVHAYDGDCYMVRGPFAAEDQQFMVPGSARH